MTTKISVPVAVAYFTVRVPVDQHSVQHDIDAERIVKAYLYAGAEVRDVTLDMDDFDRPAYIVLVRTESYSSVDHLNNVVKYQRDRLSSGMYSSTDPQILS